MVKIYYEQEADLGHLKGKKIAIIGYGNQGRAQALNLRDSGLEVIIGTLKDPTWDQAVQDGMEVQPVADAASSGDIIAVLIPDERQAEAYQQHILPALKEGKALDFAHGFNIHFGQIVPPSGVDVFMIAPKGPGRLVRQLYEEGRGVPCLIAIHQDASGRAKDIALAYAKGIGGTRAGVIETTFREETETDLFGEQVVLCGGVTALVKAAFETLVDAGYQPEIAYFECMHELKLIVDLLYEGGITRMRSSVSDTAQYGDLTRGPRIITGRTRKKMKEILTEIQSGEFAKEWILENRANRPIFNALTKKDETHLIEQVGKKLRAMMSWIGK